MAWVWSKTNELYNNKAISNYVAFYQKFQKLDVLSGIRIKFKILIMTEIAVITVDLSSEGSNRRSTQFFLQSLS